MEEIFMMWQPVLTPGNDGKSTLSCLMTALTVTMVPVDSIVLPESLLERLQLKGYISRWEKKPCVTDYTTPPEDIASEESKWKRAWVIKIELQNLSPPRLLLKNESLFIKDGRTGAYEAAREVAGLPYLVVADFADEESRSAFEKAVRRILPAEAFEMTMATLPGSNLTVFQMRLEIKPEHAKSIERIEKECSKHDGFTNFEQRVEEAEEVYNPDGIE